MDFPLRLEPIGQVASVFETAETPKFIGSSCDLFVYTHFLMHLANGLVRCRYCFIFHKLDYGLKAKQSVFCFSKLESSIDRNARSGDPSSIFRAEKSDHVSDIGWLTNPLQRLHGKSEAST
jgi:hypothetical protein